MVPITLSAWLNIKHYRLIKPGEKTVLGISGGPDSVALFLILNQLNQKHQPSWQLIIAHLNHQLRGKEANQDERFVKLLARRFKVPIYVKRQAISKLISTGKSLETVAREARYLFLAEIARKVSATTVAVGHTLNDQAETVLMKLIRGCGLRGLSGILPHRQILQGSSIKLVRPLITIAHTQIIEFLKDQKQPYRIDSTNLSPRVGLRNSIRLKLMPHLEKYNPRIKDNLFQIASIAHDTQKYLETMAKHYQPGRENSIRLTHFKKTPPALRVPVLESIIKRSKGDLKGLTYNHYKTICDWANTLSLRKKTPGKISINGIKELNLPANIRVKIADGHIRFLKSTTAKKEPKCRTFSQPEEIIVPGKTYLTRYPFSAETNLYSNKKGYLSKFKYTKSNNEEIFDWHKIKTPLKLRYKHLGDRFCPLGTKGSQSLKKFFIDHKIDKTRREKVPLLLANNNIIWVAGYRIDDQTKVTPQTKQILKIKIRQAVQKPLLSF